MNICDVAYFNDFTVCDNAFTVGKANSDPGVAEPTWACGDPMVGPMGAIGVWGTNLVDDYSNDESSYLEAPALDLSNCDMNTVELRFTHWYDIEGGNLSTWDGGNVQISTDGGTTWSVATPAGHVYDTTEIIASFVPPDGQPGFTNDSADMIVESTVDLTPYIGQPDVRIRFIFGSDFGFHAPGWYIDEYEIVVN